MLTQNMIDRLVKAAQVSLKNNHPGESLHEIMREIEHNNLAYDSQREKIRIAPHGTPVDNIGLATLTPGQAKWAHGSVGVVDVPNLDELMQQSEVATLRRLAGDNERFGRAYDKWQNLCRLHNGPLSYAILLHLYEEEVRAHDARERFGDVVKVVGNSQGDTGKLAPVDDDAESLLRDLSAFYGRPAEDLSAQQIGSWAVLRSRVDPSPTPR